jgi:hypothetical protein
VIDDATKVLAIARSCALSEVGWSSSRSRELLPQYRVDLVRREGGPITYWLGTNAHPPRFPCYALCSGWWIASSTASGVIDASRYKGLPDSVYPYLLQDLGI